MFMFDFNIDRFIESFRRLFYKAIDGFAFISWWHPLNIELYYKYDREGIKAGKSHFMLIDEYGGSRYAKIDYVLGFIRAILIAICVYGVLICLAIQILISRNGGI